MKCLAGLASISLSAGLASAGVYSVTDLGPFTNLSGRTDSTANGINNSGEVSAANVTGGAYRAFLYNGGWTNLGTLGGAESLGNGINDAGQVVGRSTTTTGDTHAFVWTAGGTDGVAGNPQMKDLGTLGGASSQANGINASGQIAGDSETAGGDSHAFVYSGGKLTDIGGLLGNSLPNSFGYGINQAGHIAGTAYNSKYATAHAFFYNGSTAKDIGGLGGSGASALALNNSDHIVGYASTANSVDHAFEYADGSMTDLGTLGGHYSYAISINNSNVIVGGSFIDTGDSVYHAFVSDGSSMTDLNNQLGASGAGWVLVEARGINDLGQIVGTGTYNGANHVFLLTPATATVTAPAIVGVNVEGHDVVLTFTSTSGASYDVQARSDLSTGSWDTVASAIAGTGGDVTFTNAGGGTLSERFYRVSASP